MRERGLGRKFARALLFGLFSSGIVMSSPGEETDPSAAAKLAFLDWNKALLETIRSQNSSPGLASRNLAILHLAVFDALNVIEDRPYAAYAFDEIHTDGIGGIDLSGTICGAASRCAQILYPTGRPQFVKLRQSQFSTASDKSAFAIAEAFGRRVADVILKAREKDGASRSITYIPKKELGKWCRTGPKFRPPELPHWKDVTPFFLKRSDQFRPPAPPSLDSVAYAQDWDEVRKLGAKNSTLRTDDQTECAEFWSCFNYTGTPAGHWNDIARDVIPPKKFSVVELARIYALLNVAMADSGIAAWECKYHYLYWRPIQAIPGAGTDGNPKTEAEGGWKSLLEAPPHPEYVSGHSTFTGAGCAVLSAFTGGGKLEFETRSSAFPDGSRRFQSLTECAEDIGRSRIYGGIHFQTSNAEGLVLGRNVGDFVLGECLQKK